MKTLLSTCNLILMISLLTSCAAYIELEPKIKPHISTIDKHRCPLAITVSDNRKKTISHGKNISSESAEIWLHQAIKNLEENFKLSPNPTKDTPVIKLGLEKAYLKNIEITKSGTVVIKVQQGEIKKYYRGETTNMNWLGSKKEYNTALSSALKEAISKFSNDADFKIVCANNESTIH